MDAKKSFFSIAKIPIAGELIVATAIYFTLSVGFAALGYLEMEEAKKLAVFKSFFYISLAYVVGSLLYRGFRAIKKSK